MQRGLRMRTKAQKISNRQLPSGNCAPFPVATRTEPRWRIGVQGGTHLANSPLLCGFNRMHAEKIHGEVSTLAPGATTDQVHDVFVLLGHGHHGIFEATDDTGNREFFGVPEVRTKVALILHCESGEPPHPGSGLCSLDEVARRMGWQYAVVARGLLPDFGTSLVLYHAHVRWARRDGILAGFDRAIKDVISGQWLPGAVKQFDHHVRCHAIPLLVAEIARRVSRVASDPALISALDLVCPWIPRNHFKAILRIVAAVPEVLRVSVARDAARDVALENWQRWRDARRLPPGEEAMLRKGFRVRRYPRILRH